MQIPYRKPGKFTNIPLDPHLTEKKYTTYTQTLKRLKDVERPFWMNEVSRLAELGDFSENVEYQLAKGKLRQINNKILKLEYHLNSAIIIKTATCDKVQLGHTVTLTDGIKEQTFTLLGPTETNPKKQVISYQSPLGSALMGKKCQEQIEVTLPSGTKTYTIINITNE
ncbi:transcription elongation factor GreA [Candidatus Parcubacteria bacterium]|uniref:Transcription elongation factor GreA n=1 Tax=Candidatus Magasanikbacteria bacterium CG10_big_fil_rev_8_21_14_0_10_38_6 TaxID=1974647 RepID=A0A2M6P0A1_9BACT|nr:transcription elongation factor GreA [Candidatus Parcubacteria bacterium]PIR76979.1 MAG: transcription elongation factor GreA [Candidatus Magasanikbacteria bacterium CG10_big_fil_rev_8_21_14_0_10_38_6]